MVDERTLRILDILDETYGRKMICYLNHSTAYELLIAVILSAQCTDARVNIVTEHLFSKYPSLDAFAEANYNEMLEDIHSIGLTKSKARNIIDASRMIRDEYDGMVPSDLEDLLRLPGVGRKTANVIRGNIYNIPSIVVDTHVKRISNRLGFSKKDDPKAIELELEKVLPEDHWILFNIQIITFGRNICLARNPRCNICPLSSECKSEDKVID